MGGIKWGGGRGQRRWGKEGGCARLHTITTELLTAVSGREVRNAGEGRGEGEWGEGGNIVR